MNKDFCFFRKKTIEFIKKSKKTLDKIEEKTILINCKQKNPGGVPDSTGAVRD